MTVVIVVISVITLIKAVKKKNGNAAFNISVMILAIVMGVLDVCDAFPYFRDCVEGSRKTTTEVYYVTDSELEFFDENGSARSLKISAESADLLLPEGCTETNSTMSKWKVNGRLSIIYYPYSGVIAEYEITDK